MEIFLTEVQAEALRDMIGTVDALPIRLAIGDGHSGHGLYASLSEYPEEGADLIAALSSQPTAPREAGGIKPCCQEFGACREMCVVRADYWQGQAVQMNAAVERAFREGYNIAYGKGISAGHPLGRHCDDADGDWRDSDARASLTGTASTGGNE